MFWILIGFFQLLFQKKLWVHSCHSFLSDQFLVQNILLIYMGLRKTFKKSFKYKVNESDEYLFFALKRFGKYLFLNIFQDQHHLFQLNARSQCILNEPEENHNKILLGTKAPGHQSSMVVCSLCTCNFVSEFLSQDIANILQEFHNWYMDN